MINMCRAVACLVSTFSQAPANRCISISIHHYRSTPMYWRIAASTILISICWVHLRPRPTPVAIPGDLFIEEKLRLHGIFPASNQSNHLPWRIGNSNERKQFQMNQLDTTAIVLDWSRLQNVVLIVAALCQDSLDDVVSQIFIWNNNPSVKLTYEVPSHRSPVFRRSDWTLIDLPSIQLSKFEIAHL